MVANAIIRGPRLTLKRRFLAQNLLLVLGMLIAAGISVWRLKQVGNAVEVAPGVYADMQTVGKVAVEAGMVSGGLSDPVANHDRIISHLRYAIGGLDQFLQVSRGYGGEADNGTRDAYIPINSAAQSARDRLAGLLGQMQNNPQAAASPTEMRATIDLALNDIDKVGSSCIGFVKSRQQSASGQLAATLLIIGLLSTGAALAAVWLSIWQYRLVMAPLQRLRHGVRAMAEAQFTQNLDPAAMGTSPEFRELADEFNRMAAELNDFYRRLEDQVRAKSLQLVRSERLASVGFLAAGVAHEINNPLNIISGYAELTSRRLESGREALDAETIGQARDNLRIIREEAFRCKEITEKLLSLSRNGSDSREDLDLARVARDVAEMTHGLKNYRDRRLTLKLDPATPLAVRANLTEMKQVLLNLTINALEATPPLNGEVCIEGRTSNGWVELCVRDNGKGMGPEVLRHVFEPFFTARRSNGDRGTGLGLSITHAIVENHNGRIEAESDGPGRGARFIVRLPAMQVH